MRLIHSLAIALALAATTTGAAADPGRYARVNGQQLYYEVHGQGGRPVVLLHGAFCTIEACFGELVAELSKTRQVIAIEMQGHGHTADIDRPLAMTTLADDVAALLKQLKIADADVLGYSLGGGVAIELARKQPKLVHKLVLVGTATSQDGMHPGMADGMKQLDAEAFKATPWYAAYKKVAPKPAQWARLVEKIQKLDMRGWTPDQLKAIAAPVLFLIGDSDIVRPEHAVAVFRQFGGGVAGDIVGLPKSQLAIVPGATHVTVVHHPQVPALVVPFLDGK